MVSALARLNRTLQRQDQKIVKYHEVVNMAITDAISRPCGGEHTPKSCMLASVATVLHRTWGVNKEMEGWMKRGSLMTMTAMNAVMNDCNHRKTRPLSTQKPCTASPFRAHVLPQKKKTVESVLKRAMTEKRERWQGIVRKNRVPMATANRR